VDVPYCREKSLTQSDSILLSRVSVALCVVPIEKLSTAVSFFLSRQVNKSSRGTMVHCKTVKLR